MQHFHCDCGNPLFFGSSVCLKCGAEVGYDSQAGEMVTLGGGGFYKRCWNGTQYGVCNWAVSSDPALGLGLCQACQMNRVIPDLRLDRNRMLWGKMEQAKRRMIYTLMRLGIRVSVPGGGRRDSLAFDIISTVANPDVTTGHLNGVITVNLEEADDTYRQINRQQLGENSRTLLGHFRHESAHYLWQRFLSNLNWDDPLRLAFRARFGDEWLDYGVALKSHYDRGLAKGWEEQYISAYAASHPWEDWAETWAHYLQIVDGLETCESLGIDVRHLAIPLTMLPGEAGTLPEMLPQVGMLDGSFLAWLQRWMCLSPVLNEISHSMGEQPLYPFTISVRVAQKLRLAHHFAQVWGGSGTGG
jgi:hypothetical protein